MIKFFFKGIKEGVKEFGSNISVIVNSVLLGIVYLLGVGLTSIFSKIRKKHFLDMKISDATTYWKDLNLKKKKMEEYFRQF